MRLTPALIIITLAASCAFAQEQVREQQVQSTGPAVRRAEKAEPRTKLSAEERKHVMQLLEASEAQARGIEDAGSRAYALLQLARGYQGIDKKKALALLEDSLTAAKSMDAGDRRPMQQARTSLQQQILNTMVPIAPQRVDELLNEVEIPVRERVIITLLGYYEKSGQTERAIEMINRIGAEKEMPYQAVNRVMGRMTPEQQPELQQLFTNALASFRDHEHTNYTFGSGDFPTLVTTYYKQLPAPLVQQAIDAILSDAKKSDEKAETKANISIASSKGAAEFNSNYEYRLFQLLPVIKELDEKQAERLLRDQQSLQALAKKYPDGLSAVAPEMSQPGGDGRRRGEGGASFMVNSGSPGGPGGGARPGAGASAGRGMPSPLEMERASKIVEDADAHPQDALANVASLSDPAQRSQAYMGIARKTLKKNPSVASSALGKALDLSAQLEPDMQLMQLPQIASMYLQMKEEDDAKKAIEKGLTATEKVYKADINADDPNTAMKAYWPSTNGWRSMIASAVKISPTWAQGLLKEIPDDDIRAIVQIGYTNSLLDVSQGDTTVMSLTKNSGRMMMMQEDRDDR